MAEIYRPNPLPVILSRMEELEAKLDTIINILTNNEIDMVKEMINDEDKPSRKVRSKTSKGSRLLSKETSEE